MKIELRSRTSKLQIPTAPPISGLILRGFGGDADYQKIADIINASAKVDGTERFQTAEDIAWDYPLLHNCDLERDFLIAEVHGQAAGYTRVWWDLQGDGTFLGGAVAYIIPEFRRQGLGTAFLAFFEERVRQIARDLKKEGKIDGNTACWYDSFVSEKESARQALLEKNGYEIVRLAYDMVRPDLENIPEAPMPEGLIVRTASRDEYPKVWEASNDAFRDHWGYIPETKEFLKSLYVDPKMDPTLWRVAWDGDVIVGMVLSFINPAENEEYRRKRGYTENICVRRAYRRKGLAKSLIVQSLHELKRRGMTEAALGVDAENVTGALHLYESCGFRVVRKNLIYRKPLILDGKDGGG